MGWECTGVFWVCCFDVLGFLGYGVFGVSEFWYFVILVLVCVVWFVGFAMLTLVCNGL